MAIFNNQRDIKFFNEIDEPMVTVGKQQGWLVIELNASIVTIGSPMSNFKLVTHEFAHCLDFVLRGKMMPNNKCHDQFFQDLNNFMGGGDIDYVNVNGHKNKVAKTLDSFNGPYHIMPSFFDVYSDKLA